MASFERTPLQTIMKLFPNMVRLSIRLDAPPFFTVLGTKSRCLIMAEYQPVWTHVVPEQGHSAPPHPSLSS